MMAMVLGSAGWGLSAYLMEVWPWLDPPRSNDWIKTRIQHDFGHWGRSFEAQSRPQTKSLKLCMGISKMHAQFQWQSLQSTFRDANSVHKGRFGADTFQLDWWGRRWDRPSTKDTLPKVWGRGWDGQTFIWET
jgi:hypothetical protein